MNITLQLKEAAMRKQQRQQQQQQHQQQHQQESSIDDDWGKEIIAIFDKHLQNNNNSSSSTTHTIKKGLFHIITYPNLPLNVLKEILYKVKKAMIIDENLSASSPTFLPKKKTVKYDENGKDVRNEKKKKKTKTTYKQTYVSSKLSRLVDIVLLTYLWPSVFTGLSSDEICKQLEKIVFRQILYRNLSSTTTSSTTTNSSSRNPVRSKVSKEIETKLLALAAATTTTTTKKRTIRRSDENEVVDEEESLIVEDEQQQYYDYYKIFYDAFKKTELVSSCLLLEQEEEDHNEGGGGKGEGIIDDERSPMSMPLLHILVKRQYPNILIWLACKLYPKQLSQRDNLNKRIPLHYAAAAAAASGTAIDSSTSSSKSTLQQQQSLDVIFATSSETKESIRINFSNTSTIVKAIPEVFHQKYSSSSTTGLIHILGKQFPKGGSYYDNEGKLSLTLYLQSQWPLNMEEFISTLDYVIGLYPHALLERTPPKKKQDNDDDSDHCNLYPFLLVSHNIDISYYLLRKDPSVLMMIRNL